jgi:hypothetical protein
MLCPKHLGVRLRKVARLLSSLEGIRLVRLKKLFAQIRILARSLSQLKRFLVRRAIYELPRTPAPRPLIPRRR